MSPPPIIHRILEAIRRNPRRWVPSPVPPDGACIAQPQLFINIDHHPSNTRFADLNGLLGP